MRAREGTELEGVNWHLAERRMEWRIKASVGFFSVL